MEVCARAPFESEVFATFRRNPGYTRVLEHVTPAHGLEYLRLLSPERRAYRTLIEAARNDTIGGPMTMRLDSGLVISPTTLRYLKVADDLERWFGNLDGLSVVEIGVGYGGQCRVLDAMFELASYTLVDLRPVLNLADRFLNCFPLRTTVSFKTMNELAPQAYDLAISNYAYSELTRDLQEIYHRKALAATPRGYITFNQIAPDEFQSLSGSELARRFNAVEMPEEPLTHPNNKILVWGPGLGPARA